MRELEGALLLVRASREGTLLVAEQLVLEDVLRQRGTVEREEWALLAVALVMQRARHKLLPRARLAEDDDAGRRRRDGLDELVYRAHLLRLSGELAVMREVGELARQRAVGLLHHELVDRLRDESLQAVELFTVERLFDVVVRALPHRLHGGIDRRL